jgi:hypothetical protein
MLLNILRFLFNDKYYTIDCQMTIDNGISLNRIGKRVLPDPSDMWKVLNKKKVILI